MSLISSLAKNVRALTMEDPAQPLQPYSVLMDMLGMTITDSGMMVNEKTAMRQPTVLACVRVKSQGLASLPLCVYERTAKGKRRVTDHRLYPILHDEPNPQMTSMAMREGAEAQRQLWGNLYLEIQRDRAGRATGLWPLPSDRTHPERTDGNLRYVTTATPQGTPRYIAPQNIIHVPGMAFDGLVGISPIQLCKQTIGRALAMDRFGAQFFGNGVRPSGAFVYAGGELNSEARNNLRQSLQSAATGANALRPLLLENGLEWKPISVPPNEAQFVEAMAQIIGDIARAFGVPLHLIQDLTRATNNNIEQQALEFVMYGLRPDAIKWEQELNRKLFDGTDYFCEHSMEGLLRGDFKTRMEGYATLFNTGAISPNMIGELENWNPIPTGEGGDLRFVQVNMLPLEMMQKMVDEPPPAAPAPGSDDGTPNDSGSNQGGGDGTPGDTNSALRRDRVKNACRALFRDAVNRTISRSKRDQETVARIWRPAMGVAAQLTSLCTVGADEIAEPVSRAAGERSEQIWQRAAGWKQEEAAMITEAELDGAYASLSKVALEGSR